MFQLLSFMWEFLVKVIDFLAGGPQAVWDISGLHSAGHTLGRGSVSVPPVQGRLSVLLSKAAPTPQAPDPQAHPGHHSGPSVFFPLAALFSSLLANTYSPAKLLQLCLTLCNAMDCSPPESSTREILQVRILEWLSMPSSRGSS